MLHMLFIPQISASQEKYERWWPELVRALAGNSVLSSKIDTEINKETDQKASKQAEIDLAGLRAELSKTETFIDSKASGEKTLLETWKACKSVSNALIAALYQYNNILKSKKPAQGSQKTASMKAGFQDALTYLDNQLTTSIKLLEAQLQQKAKELAKKTFDTFFSFNPERDDARQEAKNRLILYTNLLGSAIVTVKSKVNNLKTQQPSAKAAVKPKKPVIAQKPSGPVQYRIFGQNEKIDVYVKGEIKKDLQRFISVILAFPRKGDKEVALHGEKYLLDRWRNNVTETYDSLRKKWESALNNQTLGGANRVMISIFLDRLNKETYLPELEKKALNEHALLQDTLTTASAKALYYRAENHRKELKKEFEHFLSMATRTYPQGKGGGDTEQWKNNMDEYYKGLNRDWSDVKEGWGEKELSEEEASWISERQRKLAVMYMRMTKDYILPTQKDIDNLFNN